MTKLYISKSGSGYTPATIRGAWDKTTDHVVRGLHTAQDLAGMGGPISVASPEATATADYENLLIRAVSSPLSADHTFGGTLNVMLGAQESTADADMAFYLHAFVTQGDTDNLRGTLLANYADPNTNEWGTTALGKALTAAQSLLAVAALAGDRIVVEIGYRSRNVTASSRTGTLWHGGNGSDLTSGSSPSAGIGYVDFSDTFALVNNPTVRFSQVALESIRRPAQPNLHVTQMPIEVLRRPSTLNMRVGQMAIEVVRRNGTPPASGGGQNGMLIVVAG
ncbi:MAG: hypothetical protein IPI58_08570 [Alphaproteobacteria bacterium]|nr:MAG: hypothetical protein IPI58_08570 [Alphaproteobacteria bacterium]